MAPAGNPGYDAVIRMNGEWQTVQVRAVSRSGRIDMRRGQKRAKAAEHSADIVAAVDLHTACVHLMRSKDADERMARSKIQKRALPLTETVTCS